MNKKLKTLFIILIVILLAVIAFVGVYVKGDFGFESKLPEYQEARSLGKTIVANLEIDESVEDDAKTSENYKICKDIIEKRLKELKLPEYYVRVNDKAGNIQLEFAEDANVEAGIYYAAYKGEAKFEYGDGQEVLGNSDIENAKFGYNQSSSGAYQVYIDFTLNKDGQDKLIKIKEEKIDDVKEETTEENTEAKDTDKKSLSFKFEDEEIGTINISDITSEKTIRVNVGTSSTNSSTINSNLNEAVVISIIINSGKMPVKYKIGSQYELMSSITSEQKTIIIYTLIAIFVLICVLSLKNIKDGILLTIANIGALAIFMLLIRYTNILIGAESFIISAVLEVILAILTFKIISKLKGKETREEAKKELKNVYKELIGLFVIIILTFIVFSFTNFAEISNMGMAMFWGIVSILVSHFAFARTLLLNRRN